MSNVFQTIFDPGLFEPHNIHFIPDNVGLLWFIVTGNALIALSYVLIPLALLYLVRKREDIMFTPIFFLFAAFILLCGMTHVMHIVIFWYPVYWLEGIVLALTGVISIATFFALVQVIPLMLKLETPTELEMINNRLRSGVEAAERAKKEALKEKKEADRAREELQKKINEVEKMNKLMTDRELAMIELKKEIEKLKKAGRENG